MNKLMNRWKKTESWLMQRINPVPYFPVWAHLKADNHRHEIRDGKVHWVKSEKDFVNHIEMAGTQVAGIISYKVKDKSLAVSKHIAYPNVRIRPNQTRSNLRKNYKKSMSFSYKGSPIREELEDIFFDGSLSFVLNHKDITITRTLMPSMTDKIFIEKVLVEGDTRDYQVHGHHEDYPVPGFMLIGDKSCHMKTDTLDENFHKIQSQNLKAGVYYQLYYLNDLDMTSAIVDERRQFLDQMTDILVLKTPDPVVNHFFEMTKIRAFESIYASNNGYMHSPGGGGYYLAMWANDECEYVNPLMPFVDYDIGMNQAINSYNMFESFLKHHDIVPSSIISGGANHFNTAGDRGDAAMFAYGAARFALACDEAMQDKYFDGIKLALDYSLMKKNHQGVIASDSDELENRLPSGQANLFTSSLVYDALTSFIYILKNLNKDGDLISHYEKESKFLEKAIHAHFARTFNGYETYRYFDGNRLMRSWISVPLVMGMTDRAQGTLDALFIHMWRHEGIKSVEDLETVWDRSTLYALRAGFLRPNQVLPYLKHYTRLRLLGSHVPYPVEAIPEGNQKHLSGESALFIRVITEGLFGIRPIGYKRFIFEPGLPADWPSVSLNHILLGGEVVDLYLDHQYLIIKKGDKVVYKGQGAKQVVDLRGDYGL